tara:strand:+ start:47695 stop:47877 length:183 start_codon:yes stop_codon:yes gene_type:complete
MKEYEFNITIVGIGDDVDDAFKNALKKLSEDPESSIVSEVIYVSKENVSLDDSSDDKQYN